MCGAMMPGGGTIACMKPKHPDYELHWWSMGGGLTHVWS